MYNMYMRDTSTDGITQARIYELQTEYTKFRNDVTNQIYNAKRKFYLHEFDNCKSNNNDKWKCINNL